MMEPLFLGADIKNVWHTGKQIPRGTKQLAKLPEGIAAVETGDEGTVVSYFTNNERQYIAFVNRSCTDKTTLKIQFDSAAKYLDKGGTESPVSPSYTLDPGDIAIFTWT